MVSQCFYSLPILSLMDPYTVGLVGHLKTHFLAMHRLYMILKDHTGSPTDKELAIVSRKKVLDVEAANSYLGQMEVASANLLSIFAKQSQENVVSEILYSSSLIFFIDSITR